MEPAWHVFTDRAALAAALAEHAAARLRAALAARGAASLAVSGGATPLRFFAALSGMALDWRRVTVTLVDERWVPPDRERANERLVRTHLLQGPAAEAGFEPLFNGAPSPEAGVPEVEQRLSVLPWPPALAVLGMGEDGHTASFFPHAPELAEALDPAKSPRVAAIHPPGQEPRLTMTLGALLAAEAIALHIEGAAKRRVLEEALRDGDAAAMPVRAVLRAAPVAVFWCPD